MLQGQPPCLLMALPTLPSSAARVVPHPTPPQPQPNPELLQVLHLLLSHKRSGVLAKGMVQALGADVPLGSTEIAGGWGYRLGCCLLCCCRSGGGGSDLWAFV